MMPADRAAYRRFLVSCAATAALVWGAVLLFTACVDPYGLLDWPISQRLNGSKVVLHHEQRMAKAFAVARLAPQMLVLGNSRTGHAIDVAHPALARLPGPAYNAGFDGAHMVEIDAYLRHAFYVGALKQAIIGLDFSSFGQFVPQAAWRPEILADDRRSGALQRTLVLLRTYGGVDGLLDAWASLRQRAAPALWDVKSGRRTDVPFESRLRACGGTRVNFRIRESRDVRLNTLSTVTAAAIDSSMEVYRQTLRFAYGHRLPLRLFISPTHARSLVLLEKVGKGELWPHWKRRLVEVNAEEAARAGAAQAFPLWDFSGFNAATTENVPGADEAAPMAGYWELSHYRKSLGDRLLDRLFGTAAQATAAQRTSPEAGPAATPDALADFGVRLDPTTIARHLSDDAERGRRYEASHAEELADLYQAVRDKGRFAGPPGCAVL